MGALVQKNDHFEFNYDAATGTRHIPTSVDRRYRQGLWAAAAKAGPKVRWHIHHALRDGPSYRGAAETMEYFGARMQEVMVLTAPIVDTLEVAMPGFKAWLEISGFGNDKTMFKGFVKWAEHREKFTGAGDILEATRVVLN